MSFQTTELNVPDDIVALLVSGLYILPYFKGGYGRMRDFILENSKISLLDLAIGYKEKDFLEECTPMPGMLQHTTAIMPARDVPI